VSILSLINEAFISIVSRKVFDRPAVKSNLILPLSLVSTFLIAIVSINGVSSIVLQEKPKARKSEYEINFIITQWFYNYT
jgi:hypothetical protein